MTRPRKRLSVSAIRDYQKCGRFYYYKRVAKIPESRSHHADAGTLVHNTFYAAYATPELTGTVTGRNKIAWKVHDDFKPDLALALFDLFWNRVTLGQPFEELVPHVREALFHNSPAERGELLAAFRALEDEMPVVTNFKPGQLKALGKGQKLSQGQLKHGWGDHFRAMLEASLKEPFRHPVKEIEREVVYKLGSTEMLGYVDIVLETLGGEEVFIDLKTGYNKPSDKELRIDDQVQGYYEAQHPVDFWYFHMKSGEIISVDDQPELRRFLAHTADQVSEKIHQEDFTPRFTKDGCAQCAYFKECIGNPLIHLGPFEQKIPGELPADLPAEPQPQPDPYVPLVLF